MSKPSNKSEAVNSFLEEIANTVFGASRMESILTDLCVSCKGDAITFKDDISRKEFGISGMCQTCQDSVFGTSETKKYRG